MEQRKVDRFRSLVDFDSHSGLGLRQLIVGDAWSKGENLEVIWSEH